MTKERIQHLQDVIFTADTLGSRDKTVKITHEEAREFFKLLKLENELPPIERCKYCNGTGIIKDQMAGEGCIADCIYCQSENEKVKDMKKEMGNIINDLERILLAIQKETKVIDNHPDPSALNDCWNSVRDLISYLQSENESLKA